MPLPIQPYTPKTWEKHLEFAHFAAEVVRRGRQGNKVDDPVSTEGRYLAAGRALVHVLSSIAVSAHGIHETLERIAQALEVANIVPDLKEWTKDTNSG